MLPIRKNNKITTPHELVHGEKVDLRNLLPMFSVAYIKQERNKAEVGGKWKTQTLKCITVGKCPRSDSILFYHPPSKQLLSCANGYKYDTFSPAGPQFNEQYDGKFIKAK